MVARRRRVVYAVLAVMAVADAAKFTVTGRSGAGSSA